MKTIEEKYEEYLQNAKENKMMINGQTFYRIISKDHFNISGRGDTLFITVPYCMFGKNKIADCKDENGNIVHLIGPAHIKFSGPIPKWYFESGEFIADGYHFENELGEYLSLV